MLYWKRFLATRRSRPSPRLCFQRRTKIGAGIQTFYRSKDLRAHLDSLVRKDKGVSYLLVLGESAMKRRDYAAAEKHFKGFDIRS